jgi:hypothetical protein
VDRLPKDVSDDADLDALMTRVREAAMGRGSNGNTAPTQLGGDAAGRDLDLVRVLDAQAEWNEHASKSLAALVECLQTLRDDYVDAHSRIGREVERLSAIVKQKRVRADTNAGRTATRRRVAVKRRKRSKGTGNRA